MKYSYDKNINYEIAIQFVFSKEFIKLNKF